MIHCLRCENVYLPHEAKEMECPVCKNDCITSESDEYRKVAIAWGLRNGILDEYEERHGNLDIFEDKIK